ncbi:Dna Damage-Inducible Transcript 4-Like Protein [Manis pentadactyla]|nr:Dna Damage-Inducible Transcript 4-Like Protein [Manis pentadactyla]
MNDLIMGYDYESLIYKETQPGKAATEWEGSGGFALLEQCSVGRRLEASTSLAPASVANTNFSLENTVPCGQRLCVMFQYLPDRSSVKDPARVPGLPG